MIGTFAMGTLAMGGFAIEVGLALCVQVTLVVLVTVVLQRFVDQSSSACRLWSICFVSILGLVAAAVLLPHRRLLAFPEFISPNVIALVAKWQGTIAAFLIAVWVAGMVIRIVRSGLGCIRLMRFFRNSCQPLNQSQIDGLPITISKLNELLNIRPQQTCRRGLLILVSDQIQGPFCWQLHRPIVVLPAFLFDRDIDASSTSLGHVLRHEIEHLRTKHPMQHFLQGVCSTVFWFHPAVHAAAHGAELQREYLCDEVAAMTSGKFGVYLRTLVTIAERCGGASCMHVPKDALAFGNRKSALIKRSNRLVRLAGKKNDATHDAQKSTAAGSFVSLTLLIIAVVGISQFWLPVNANASKRTGWSPWPTWTAKVLHDIDIHVRDFEPFDEHTAMYKVFGNKD